MGIRSFVHEVKANASPKRLFQGLITKNVDVIPKVDPHVKSIETIGDGGVGSVKKTTFSDGANLTYMHTRIDYLDTENYVAKFTLFEGELLGDKLEKICYEMKFEDSKDGGCVIKLPVEYHSKGDVELKDADVKAAGIDVALKLYKEVGDYLAANPHVCS